MANSGTNSPYSVMDEEQLRDALIELQEDYKHRVEWCDRLNDMITQASGIIHTRVIQDWQDGNYSYDKTLVEIYRALNPKVV